MVNITETSGTLLTADISCVQNHVHGYNIRYDMFHTELQ